VVSKLKVVVSGWITLSHGTVPVQAGVADEEGEGEEEIGVGEEVEEEVEGEEEIEVGEEIEAEVVVVVRPGVVRGLEVLLILRVNEPHSEAFRYLIPA